MKARSLPLPGFDAVTAPPVRPVICSMCGGPFKAGRCRPCQKDPPAPGGPAWKRWTRGIDRVVRARLAAAGLDRCWFDTIEALYLDDRPIPEATRALVADIAVLPFSRARYQRVLHQALTRSQIGRHLYEQGLRGTVADPHRVDNIAARAAALIWAQRDRVARGEAFERRHDAELVEQALVEMEAREQLRAAGWRNGRKLEREILRLVEQAMCEVRGRYGRPSDDYPKAVRVELGAVRIAVTAVRIVEDADDDEATEVVDLTQRKQGMR